MFPLTALLLLTSTPGTPSGGAATAAIPQDTLTVKEAEPGLKAQAKVTSERAIRFALARVPGGTIREAELEKEGGRLVYSFDIRDPRQPGVEEVLIDAKSGKVVSAKHESPAAEAKERAAETKHQVKADTMRQKHDSTK